MIAVPPSPSGLPAVDRQWGGLAAGRAYLLVGRAGAGRSALALQTARAAIDAGERCLIISPRAPESLVEIGQGVGLDLAAAHAAGSLRLLRIPSAADLASRGPEGLAKSYRDLAGLVTDDKPGRVIVEDFTPLVQFDTFERFHDAFSGLVAELRTQGTTLMIGLGDPANNASRRLLDVVESLVDGTIRLGSGGDLTLTTPGQTGSPSKDDGSREAAPPPSPEANTPTVDESLTARAEPPLAPSEPQPPTPNASEPGTTAPPPPAVPEEDAPQEAAPEPDAPDASGIETPSDTPQTSPAPPAAPQTADPLATAEVKPESASGGLVETDIVAPPPTEQGLLDAGSDPFGYDPADSLFEQGYLADSGVGAPVPGSPRPAPAPYAAPQPPAAPSASMPSFAPLGAAEPSAGFRPALDRSFTARAAGTPFQMVAVRMEPETPAGAHFAAVEAGLRAALRPGDELLVDTARKRAAVVLPASGPEAGQALFSSLQAHLRAVLGSEAESVLHGVAAVTISDGQPFQSAAELIAYAIEN